MTFQGVRPGQGVGISERLLRPEARGGQPQGIDLLGFRPVRRLVRWPGFPYAFQAAMLLGFLALAVAGWGQFAPEGVNGKIYAKSNIVTLVIWGLWWPAMVWTAVWFGRVWCAVCPLELVANGTERLARRLGFRQRPLWRWLRSGGVIVGLYALIQLLVEGVELHRVPAYTSLFLWGLLALAGAVGLVFKDRAFCRGFCPVGMLLNVYGRGGALAVRAGSSQTCAICTGKDCLLAGNRDRLDGRSCPSLLNPPKLNSNRDCLVCGQCIKACQPGNMRLLLRRPFHPADAREALASGPITMFVFIVSGFVTYELCSEWKAASAVFLWAPEEVAAWLGVSAYEGWMVGVWKLFVFPLLLWTFLGGLTLLLRGARDMLSAWRRLALPVAVLFSAGHMAKGLAKVASWAGFLPHALREPMGIRTALGMSAKAIAQPGALLPMPAVSGIATALVLGGAWFAWREARLAEGEHIPGRAVSVLAAAGGIAFLTFGWGFIG